MNRKNNEPSYTEGKLPCTAPLVNPYVPFQFEKPPRYESRKALVRGTLYPGLDLPFMGMVNKNEKPVTPMTELQATDFAIQELVLYLDTHRDDKEAFEVYTEYLKKYRHQEELYEKKYGPLTNRSIQNGCYQWPNDPWPWEYAKNREV